MYFYMMRLQLANWEKIEKLDISAIGDICHDLGAINVYYFFLCQRYFIV